VYIGLSTKNDPNYLGSGQRIKNAIKKYGKANFTKEIIEYCEDYYTLCEREIFWIKYYKDLLGDNCYNVASGGSHADWRMYMSDEEYERILHKIKISKQKKEKKSSWNKGLSYKNIKISIALSGKKQTKETIEKRKIKLIGKKRTKDQIEKQSNAIKERYKNGFSEEHKKNLSISHIGVKMSESAKNKLRKKHQAVECPYCNKKGGGPIMKRYHFDNCKNK
jgi:hypothetical protein